MEKPKCKMCGERHWSREACTFDAAARQVRIEAAETAIRPHLKFDKVAYQREYMRKRRAKAKINAGESK